MVIRAPKGVKPYKGTPISVDQSKLQITKLLRDYGANGVSWTDNFETGEVQLRFVVEREAGPKIGFRVTPAAFKERHRSWDPVQGKEVVTEAPDWKRSLRLLHDWVKNKLISVAFGLTSIEEEFMAQRIVLDLRGRETTVGELVTPTIEAGGGRLALEAPRPREGTVEATGREVG